LKKVNKTEVKSLINYLEHTKDEYVGFNLLKDGIELQHSNTRTEITYRIDGYLKNWKDGAYAFQECIERIQDYMNDVIEFYNEKQKA
jgi:uncharacterized protein with NRDE domain